MLPVTDSETYPNYLLDVLPEDTDWDALHAWLESRLAGGISAADVMTVAERRLLAGLRMRASVLDSPLYRRRSEEDSRFWVALIMGAGALLAK